MDETTDVSVKKQCECTVLYYDTDFNKFNTTFFDLKESESGNATDLYNCLKHAFTSKNIPIDNLVGFSADTTNVMDGDNHYIFSLLRDSNPNIVCIKCSCHMIHLAASKACLKLRRSTEDLLRNIGSNFSRSSAKQKKLKEFQIFFRVEILPPAISRWLSLKECVNRILEWYDVLIHCVFEDNSLTTEQMLCIFDNPFTKLYLD